MYVLAPSPDLSTLEQLVATWHGGFSDEDLANIISLGEEYELQDGMAGGQVNNNIRKTLISWIPHTQNSQWLWDRIGFITRQLNGQFFEFNLSGMFEKFQYTVYHPENHHYEWHMDRGTSIIDKANTGTWNPPPRKLSLVLQLTDPSEYEGGELQLFTRSPYKDENGVEHFEVIKKEKGMVVAFPSFVMHRVTPVTKGIRRTLVIWVGGPKFK